MNGKTKFTCGKTRSRRLTPVPRYAHMLGILPSTCHFQYMEPRWPYLHDKNIHHQREDIHWASIQHAILDQKHLHRKDLSVINSMIDQECHLGDNVSIHNAIVGNRVTLGNNCVIQSIDFSKEV